MSALLQVTDENVGELLSQDCAVLILSKSTCGYCSRYKAEIEELLSAGSLSGVVVGTLVLDRPGSSRFKRTNTWLAGVDNLPFTVLYRSGQQHDAFAASKATYLLERIEPLLRG